MEIKNVATGISQDIILPVFSGSFYNCADDIFASGGFLFLYSSLWAFSGKFYQPDKLLILFKALYCCSSFSVPAAASAASASVPVSFCFDMKGLTTYTMPPIIPRTISIANKSSEQTVALSFAAPSATIKKTREFSLIPIPPIDMGSIAIVETMGTMKINDANDSSIPSAFEVR